MYRGRILAITDAPFAETGYGNQSDKILSELVKRGWEVYHICGNYYPSGNEVLDSEGFMIHKGIKCILYPKIWEGPVNLYASKEFVKEWYDKLKPDCIWTLNDFYRVAPYLDIGEEFINKWVHWLPVDNEIPDKSWAQFEDKMKFLIFLTKFGESHESPWVPDVKYKSVIYHGINPDEFKPLDKMLVKDNHGMKNRFVITTVARHQPRKMVYHTAHAVCRFLQKHEDATWVCKCNPDDPAMAGEPEMERDLNKLVKSYGVEAHVMFVANNLPTDQMNDLYNTGDIFICLTGGEGFNIPVAESMMAGVTTIITNSTSGPELSNKGEVGILIPVENKKFVPKFGTLYDIADLNEAVDALEHVYNDWKIKDSKILKEAGEACRAYAIEKFGISTVVDQWEDVLWRIIRNNNPILWHAHFGRGVGFTAVSEAIVPELDRMGYDMYINDLSGGQSPILKPYFLGLYNKYLTARDKINFEDKTQVICNLMETFEFIRGKMRMGWSFSESTKIRSFYRPKCEAVNYIISSSEFNKEAQKNSGINTPVVVVPPCIDQNDFHYLERPNIGERPFTFLHIGVLQERKNPEQIINGYLDTFEDNGKTKLIVKSNDFGKVDQLIERYKSRKDLEFLYTSDKPLTQEEMLKLYESADCYVNLSHGEGIGMPDLEALATGLPVIGSNWDTRKEFLDDEVGWMVKVSHMDKAYKHTFPEDDCGEWAHFDGEDYIRILKYVAENPIEAREKGRKGAERVKDKFTVQKSAEVMDELFMDVYKNSKLSTKSVEQKILKPNYNRIKKIQLSPVVKGDRILVAIPTKDRMESLRRTFYSLMQQSIKNFDIAVVDDTKDDRLRTDKTFNDELSMLSSMGVSVYMIKGNGTNQADAHNLMMKHALSVGYKLVFRCDDDITLDSYTLEKLYNEFLKDEKCEYAAMGGIMLCPFYPTESQKIPADWRSQLKFAGKVEACDLHAQVFIYPDDVEYRDDIEHLYSSYMYRPELLNSIGGFPVGLSAVGFREETYGLYELYLQKYKLKIVTKAIGYHWHESTGGCRSVQGDDAAKLYARDDQIFKNRIAELEKKYNRKR